MLLIDPKNIKDVGPEPIVNDIETAQEQNEAYRRVLWTGKYLQVVLMTIPVGGEIGLETHPETDQFIRVDAGTAEAQVGDSEDCLDAQTLEDGFCVIIPAGKWHNVVNTGEEPLRLYTVYSPSHHAQGIVQETKEAADADEEAGRDEPPTWTHQPAPDAEDESA